MPASLYLPVYLVIIGVLCFGQALILNTSTGHILQEKRNGTLFGWLLCIFLVIWLGTRPVSGVFVDMKTYAYFYNNISFEGVPVISLSKEWFWEFLMWISQKAGLKDESFFVIVEALYIIPVFLAVKRFTPTNVTLGFLFVISSLMFFSFGVNGLRNGTACHLTLWAIALFYSDKYIGGAVVALLAFGIHRSIMLPVACVLAGRYLITDYKYTVYLWFACIVISAVAGSFFTQLISSFSVDDRLANYIAKNPDDTITNPRFRIDFIIYSFPPILLGWYVLVKKKIHDEWYRALCIAYTLCNAFWILIIRVEFTNRFAYLSWFMYPILIAYPLINLPLWKNQDKVTAVILAAYAAYTILMFSVVW